MREHCTTHAFDRLRVFGLSTVPPCRKGGARENPRESLSAENLLAENENWDMIIQPQRGWWDIRLGELWLLLLSLWKND